MKQADSDPKSGDAARFCAGPFLKWAGGKSQMLPHLAPFFPPVIKRYFEPFLGGGAVFFYLMGQRRLADEVVLADVNVELINVYRAVQTDTTGLVTQLQAHQVNHCKDYYYDVRARPFTADLAGAARTIYLNRTCYNGLYRVNSKGDFNVPIGDYQNPVICDVRTLHSAAQALHGVTLLTQSYEETLALCRRGDLVYLDPPYLPLSATASFTTYTPGGFRFEDHQRLAEAVLDCHRRGAVIVLSHSCTEDVSSLYSCFHIHPAPARRSINCVAARRTGVQEVIISNRGVSGELI